MTTGSENVEQIPLSAVAVAGNIRTTFDDEKLRELADSIRERGVLHPIVLRRKGQKLELIAGERRLRAAKMAGLKTIPAIIRDADDAEVAFDRIIENLQREDLSDEDQYRALKTLRDRGLTVARISKMTGLSSTTIQRVLVLETLKPSIRKRDDVSSYAKAFIARAPAHVQDVLAERVAAGAITSKQLGHEVMPAISEATEEKLFSEGDRKNVIQRIAREASTERPARSIVWQERGRKQLQRDGIDVQVASKQILKEMLDLSQRYQDKLLALYATRFDHLDPGLVIGLFNLFKRVHDILGDILAKAEAARKRQ
jgi:ParB family transcriptional regulator, chromosome partitioning protein